MRGFSMAAPAAAVSLAVILGAVAPAGGASQTVTYAYDAVGRLTSATYDSGWAVQYTYDASGNLVRIQSAADVSAVPGASPVGPAVFAFSGMDPSPLVRHSTLRFQLPREAHARLLIYDVAGRRIRTLQDAALPAGYHAVVWDGRDEHGARAASGVYFARFEAETFSATKKLVVAR